MGGVALYYFNNYNMVIYANSLSTFYVYLSEDINQDSPDPHAYMINIY